MRQLGPLKGLNRLGGSADDWIAVKVERRVEDGPHARPLLEASDQPVVRRVVLLTQDLGPGGGVVGMNGRRQGLPPLRGRVEGQHHEG